MRRFVLLLFIAAAVCAAQSAQATSRDELNRSFAAAESLLKAGRPARALRQEAVHRAVPVKGMLREIEEFLLV